VKDLIKSSPIHLCRTCWLTLFLTGKCLEAKPEQNMTPRSNLERK
jgi:hypothetical protein